MSRAILIDDDSSQYQDILRRLRRLEQATPVPTGAIVLWRATTAIPAGWLRCNGGTFSATDYPQLGALWGTTSMPADPGLTGYVAIVRAR